MGQCKRSGVGFSRLRLILRKTLGDCKDGIRFGKITDDRISTGLNQPLPFDFIYPAAGFLVTGDTKRSGAAGFTKCDFHFSVANDCQRFTVIPRFIQQSAKNSFLGAAFNTCRSTGNFREVLSHAKGSSLSAYIRVIRSAGSKKPHSSCRESLQKRFRTKHQLGIA